MGARGHARHETHESRDTYGTRARSTRNIADSNNSSSKDYHFSFLYIE